jgi:pilus assembly protein CpaB
MRNRVAGGRGGKAVLLLALFLGLISAVLVYVYLSQAGGEETAASGETEPVVVATQDIPVATRITADMVQIKEVSMDAVHPDSFSSTEEVVGNLARYPITAGEQILSDRVAASSTTLPEGEELPLPYIVPEGKRAVSVAIDQLIGAGGLLRPGDYVDVILTVKLQVGDQIGRIILQDLEVLALDQQLEKVAPKFEDGADEERTTTGEGETDPEAVTVTLAVTPKEGEVLVTAETCADNFGGRLGLAVRPFGDHTTVELRTSWPEEEKELPPRCAYLFGVGLSNLKAEADEESATSTPSEP